MELPELPPTPEPLYRLPIAVAAQWQSALLAAEHAPFSHVTLEAQVVIAVHDAVERAALAERERASAKLDEFDAWLSSTDDDPAGWAVRQRFDALAAAIRAQGSKA